MKNTREEIIGDFRERTASDIYHDYLKSHDVWLFREHMGLADHHRHYDSLRRFIGEKLEINTANVAIVGSAKTGFSFSPKKDFKPFDDNSDLDMVLVDSQIFKNSWHAFLDLKYDGRPYGGRLTKSNLFRRFITLKDNDFQHSYFISWFKKVNAFKKDFQTSFDIDADITYRVYEDWDAVDKYHLCGIEQLKISLLEKER